MKKDQFKKEGYICVYDYYWNRPIYYTPDEYAEFLKEEERKRKLSRLHLLEGYMNAFSDIDFVFDVVFSESDEEAAKNKLRIVFSLTKRQATAILQLKLCDLSKEGRERLANEFYALKKEVQQ